ncbi:MAG: radical SAM family heme chaperone HemW, partial [Clostridia bacterium]|nr:radical SAM family heme chaperone HemW [Clostridia bacterium]
MNKKELGVYIHIPFCKQKCSYCDFVSFANKIELQEDYVEALKQEIIEFDFTNYNVTTIYFGGGTPSYLDSKHIVDIMEILKSKIGGVENKEITIEVNPGTANKQKLENYKKSGINRLSIGLQTTNDTLLKQIGRIHTYQNFLETYNFAKAIGFDNINVDLMLGLPNQTIKDLKNSLEDIKKLDVSHISVYSLIVEEGTSIEKMIEEGKMKLPSEELERQMYWYVKDFLEINGYKHYEISNFSKKNHQSKHNMNCWEQKEYVGFGVSAHSYLDSVRSSNTVELEMYIKNYKDGKFKKNIEEIQNLDMKQKEYMMLGLRKIDGVDISRFKEKYFK